MFVLYARKNVLSARSMEPLTSGSINVYTAKFEFSADWEGLTTKAVFKGSGSIISVLLDENGACQIPWETLARPGGNLYAGVYGTLDETVLPTVWADLGVILQGVVDGDNESPPPSPNVWEQLVQQSQEAVETVRELRAEADEGGFIGPRGPQGEQGPQGERGPVGPQGPQGIQGERGPTGPTGPRGERGEKGDIGPIGPIGPRGETGEIGPAGPQGPEGQRGADGTVGFDELTPEQVATLRGEKGDQGPAGPEGPRGPAGPEGPQGVQGPKGDRGQRGEQGPRGEAGLTGPAGKDGQPGKAGPRGEPGTDGFSPTVSVSEIVGGHRVAITDADGPTSFDVMDGAGDVQGVPFSVVLPTSGWADGAQSVSDSRFFASGRYSYIVGGASPKENRDEYNDCGVRADDIAVGGVMTFYCDTDPKRDLTVNIQRLENPSGGPSRDTAPVFNCGGGASGGFRLDHIAILTPPEKTVYKSGETFIRDGMTVQAVYANGAAFPITTFTWEPTVLTDGVENVTVLYTEGRATATALQPVTVLPVLASISVTKEPDKMDYIYGDTFQKDGMEVTAHYSDGSSKPAVGFTAEKPTFDRVGEFSIQVSFTEDGITKTTELTMNVGKAAGNLSIDPTSLSLSPSNPSQNIEVTRAGDGAITVQSSDPAVAEAELNGTTITVTAKGNGNAVITVNVAEGTNHTAPPDQTASVSVSLISPILSENSLETISEVSKAGTGDTYWDIGDTYPMHLKGTVGTITLDTTLYVYIVHFNMPMNKTEPDNNIIWQGFKSAAIDGVDVALRDWTADQNSGGYKYDGTKRFNMNHWGSDDGGNYNYGGWKGCDLRYDILGATSTAPSNYGKVKAAGVTGYDATAATLTSPVPKTVLAAMPADWRGIIRLWTRYIDAVGNSSDYSSGIKATVDAITLLAVYEVFGTNDLANKYEKNHQVQVDYYNNGNSKIRYAHDSTSQVVMVWLASPYKDGAYDFCFCGADGKKYTSTTSALKALSPAFKT